MLHSMYVFSHDAAADAKLAMNATLEESKRGAVETWRSRSEPDELTPNTPKSAPSGFLFQEPDQARLRRARDLKTSPAYYRMIRIKAYLRGGHSAR